MKHFLNKWNFLLLVAIILLSVVLTWPSLLHISSQYIGDGGDNYEYASYQMLASHRIQSGLLPFGFTNFWRYPVGFDFARGFDSYLTVILGTTLNLFIAMPLAYNLTIFLLMSLNGIFSYLFFKELTKSKLLALIGMLIYGFSFYTIGKAASHPNLLFIGGFPLLGLTFLRLLKKETHFLKDYLYFFLALLVIAIGSSQYFLMLFIFLPIYLLLCLIFYKRETILFIDRLININCLKALLLFLISFFVIYFPQINAIINHSFVFLKRGDVLLNLTPSLSDFILPNPYLKLVISSILNSQSSPSIEKLVFIGFVEIIILLIAIFYSLHLRNKKFCVFLITLFVIPFGLSLGFGKNDNLWFLPYHFLSNIFPFSTIPETGRYFVVFNFFIAVILVSLLSNLQIKKRNYVLILLIIFLILERLPSSFYLTPSLKNLPYQKIVQNEKSSAVLDLPINFYYPNYDILSFYYNKPIVNGYFHWSADTDKEKSFILKDNLLSRYICYANDSLQNNQINNLYEANLDGQMISLLKTNGINTIVVHKDDKFYYPVCKSFRERLSRLIASDYVPLETTPMTAEKQLNNYFWEGKPNFTYYSPDNGKLYLDGVYIAPGSKANFNILVDGKPLENYSWSVKKDYSMELLPKYAIIVNVRAGSLITFSSPVQTNDTYFSLWYRFIPDNNSPKFTYESTFQKLFEDNNAIVYQLR